MSSSSSGPFCSTNHGTNQATIISTLGSSINFLIANSKSVAVATQVRSQGLPYAYVTGKYSPYAFLVCSLGCAIVKPRLSI